MNDRPPHFGVTAPTCPHCGARITVHERFRPGHCGSPNCMHLHAVSAGNKRDEVHAKIRRERDELARERGAAGLRRAAELLECEVEGLQVSVVPYMTRPVSALPDDEKSDFLGYIEEAVTKAFENGDEAIVDSPFETEPPGWPTALEAAGCRACEGSCCSSGRAARAFLTVSSLAEIMRAKPELGPDDLIAHYTDALPDVSIEDSCVYHGVEGCVLARDWRSSTCNSFKCTDLNLMTRLARQKDDQPVAIVALSRTEDTMQILAHRDTMGTTILGSRKAPSDDGATG